MITVTERALNTLGLPFGSRIGAVQAVRDLVGESNPSATVAVKLINGLLGTSISQADFLTGVDPKLAGDYGLMVAQGVAEMIAMAGGLPIDEVDVLIQVKARVARLMADAQHKWMFAKTPSVSSGGPTTEVAMIHDIDVKVEVKADGKIKKGGREVMAEALYQKRVIDSGQPVTNQEFIQILIKELGMTKGGATTYAYNVDKKMGNKLIKKQRGAAA